MRDDLAPDRAATLDARMRVLRSVAQQRPIAQRLRAIRDEASKTLGPDHQVTLEAATAAAWASTGVGAAKEIVREYERLLVQLEGRQASPAFWAPNGARSGYARALRRAGDSRALNYYRTLAAERTAEDARSRSASIARLNLSVALRDGDQLGRAAEGQRIATDEVALRTKLWGADDRFTLSARAEAVQAALTVARLGGPSVQAAALLAEAQELVDLREKILGPLNEATLKSRITLAETMVEAGQVERALWLLTQVRAASLHVPLDSPWRIPRVIAECCLRTGDLADLRDGVRYAEQAMAHALRILGPEAGQSVRCRETLTALLDRLDESSDFGVQVRSKAAGLE